MKVENRLILPLGERGSMMFNTHLVVFGGRQYVADTAPKVELSFDECEMIIANIPAIIDFIIGERITRNYGPDGLLPEERRR